MGAQPSISATLRQLASIVRVVISHRELWITAVRQAIVLIPNRWWASSPRLPIPDSRYMAFRMVTTYGGDGLAVAEPGDVVTYLQWCRSLQR